MHPIDERDLPSLVLMTAGLFMSAYGQLLKHTGFVLGGFVFFYMGTMILKPLPKAENQTVKASKRDAQSGGRDGEDRYDSVGGSNLWHRDRDGRGGSDGISRADGLSTGQPGAEASISK